MTDDDLTPNAIDLSNYYTKSQVDALIKHREIISNSSSSTDINNRYDENMLIPITASNVESWIARYIYSDSDRFRKYISCGTIEVNGANASYGIRPLIIIG